MAKPRILVELRPDPKLLDSQFDGYKLSLEPVPIHRSKLPSRPDHVVPSEDQYSFLHTKLFGLHNKLFHDTWTESIYYIDDKWKIYTYDSESNVDCQFVEVWEVPSHHERQPGHYNLCMSFASPDVVVITDGAGTLHIVDSGDRSFRGRKWEVVYSCEPIGEQKGFVVLDSQFYCGEIHCLLLSVAEQDVKESDRKKSKFVSIIDWVIFEGELSHHNWEIKAKRQITGSGSIDFAALEPTCTALFVASDQALKFASDTDNPVIDANQKTKVEMKPQTVFSWLQKGDDVTIWIPLATNTSKSDVKVTSTSSLLQVSLQGKAILEGPLHQRIDPDLTTWTCELGKLEIILSKAEFGVVWSEVIVGCQKGEEISDSSFVEEVHQRLAHLCSDTIENASSGVAPGYNSQELEDCDDFPRDTSVLLRLDSKDHSISHQASLGGHQWLFNVNLKAGAPSAVCVRHDVDACVWQIDELDRNSDTWPITHVGTFLAFGYVQASKQQRKFTVCPADMSYAAICDASRHVYVYRQPSALNTELRHRTNGRRIAQIAKQQLVQLQSDAQVLGCQATSKHLFLLTEDFLLKLILNQ